MLQVINKFLGIDAVKSNVPDRVDSVRYRHDLRRSLRPVAEDLGYRPLDNAGGHVAGRLFRIFNIARLAGVPHPAAGMVFESFGDRGFDPANDVDLEFSHPV